MVIENTFTNIDQIADNIFPFLKAVPNLKRKMLRLDWNSLDKIRFVRTPILFIGGAIDKLCPLPMTMALHKAATKTTYKDLFVVPDGDHNDTFLKAGANYYNRVHAFLTRCCDDDPGKVKS